MRIGNNISAMNTLNRLTVNNSQLSKSLEKLSSGSAINRASDDAAGLAISEKMRAQIAGLEQASKNAQDGISLVQTAEGALDQTHTALRRMYTLAMQAKNGTITTEDRSKIQDEINARINEIDRVADTANFNGIKLFDGSLEDGLTGLTYTEKATAADVVAGSAATAPDAETTGALAVTVTAAVEVTFGAANTVDATAEVKAQYNALIDALATDGIDINISSDSTNPDGITLSLSGYTLTGTIDIGDDGAQSIAISQDGTALGSISFTLSADSIGSEALVADKTVNVKLAANAVDAVVAVNEGDDIVRTDGVGKALELQIGASSADADKIDVSINRMNAASLLVQADGTTTALTDLSEAGDGSLMSLDMTTPEAASAAINSINSAIEKVSEQRASLGAVQNRLEQTIENLSTTAENMSAAESRIRDVDMAKEMTNFTKNSILSQASQAMLAQANALPQGVLQLLG